MVTFSVFSTSIGSLPPAFDSLTLTFTHFCGELGRFFHVIVQVDKLAVKAYASSLPLLTDQVWVDTLYPEGTSLTLAWYVYCVTSGSTKKHPGGETQVMLTACPNTSPLLMVNNMAK
jgi:hypothetical protein